MKCPTPRILRLSGLALAILIPTSGQALNLADTPLFLSGSVQPLVMLDLSKDHQLWKKAYNDYSDLDDDGQLEITYKHSIDYYGYFDPKKCYTYSAGNQRFEPASESATKYCSGQWSGNFLNWAGMSRMDAVRKLLYGGKRVVDQTYAAGGANAITVLERAYIPPDAHAWSKYYDGADLAQLTPYTPPTTTTTSSTSHTITNTGANTVNYTFTLSSATGFAVNDYVQVDAGSGNFLKGQITGIAGSNITISVANVNYGGSGTHSSWTVSNLSKRGLTVCNMTPGSSTSPQNWSHTNTNAPQIRFAAGNFSLWNANESWQCRWSEETNTSNANNFAHSGIPAGSSNPTLATHGTGTGLGNYVARVQVCKPSLLGSEKCKQYPDGNYKPIGLLQVYGDTNQIHFGLITGSYTRNISGGVLRKNAGPFTDEINVGTDGTLTSTVGIVKTLDRLRIYGFYYGGGNGYSNSGSFDDNSNTTSNCSYRVTNLVENSCTSSWGNPMAELFYESIRYFANDGTYSPLYGYTNAGSKDNTLGLPQPAWTQAVNQVNYCAPLNALVFNTSVSSDDRDFKDVALTDIGSASTPGALTDAVGTGESISGEYFIGANGSTDTGRCDAKTVTGLGSVYGICPEGPTLEGSYLIAGVAHQARVNKIRSDLTVPADDKRSLKVSTYGVQLATNVPRVAIALQGETTPRVILQPAYWMYDPYRSGGGALVDMKIVSQEATATTASGQLYVNYETSEAGADHDQDAWGIIRYCLTTVAGGCGVGSTANTIRVTTDIISESAGSQQGFGYTISGTTQDGAHFHSGTDGFNFTDPTGVLGCNNCMVGNAATHWTYTLGATTAGILKDPLYYAAKWGGFNDLNNNGIPDSATEWDVLKADGSPGSDGLPDNYFYVSNPLGLETALNAAFLKILKDSSASAVATNSSTLNTGSRIFQGRFSSSFWSGQLLSYRIDPVTRTVVSATNVPHTGWDSGDTPYPEWDAGHKIKSQASVSSDSRVILTKGSTGAGTSFEYANLGTSQQTALDQDWLFNLPADDCGPERVAYLRGHSVNEGVGTFTCASGSTIMRFRTRPVSPLGDIINANPAFVGPPKAGYTDVDHPGYSAFSASFKDRTPVVYVGANDGMLHGFEASIDNSIDPVTNEPKNVPTANAGKEVLAYVPTPVYSNLSRLTDSAYSGMHKYFVDGSPMVADACVSTTSSCSSSWKTVLVGTLGAGGKGLFALNVTNPKDSAKHSTATPLFSTANAASILLWEFTSADDADLGYTYNHAPVHQGNGQAKQIAKFQNGRWGVAVGNGYNSTSGKAALYVIFLSGPSGTGGVWQGNGVDYMKIVADVGPNNGLSTPVLFDANGDGLVDTAYAGDLKGKLWKFDLSNASPASWAMALGGTPLFSATDASNNAQPITTPPDVTIHPAGGRMVVFGTGKYLETTDNSSTGTQTLYGIRDQNVAVGGRADLTPQVFTTVTLSGGTFRTLDAGCDDDPLTPEPACPATSKGWRIDLPTSGERATGSPKIEKGVAWFNTFIPSVTPCDFGGTGWLLAVNYVSGEMPNYKAFNTTDDNTIDGSDTIVAGQLIGAALGGSTLIEGSDLSVAVSSLTTGATDTATVDTGGLGGKGRITWREIIVQ